MPAPPRQGRVPGPATHLDSEWTENPDADSHHCGGGAAASGDTQRVADKLEAAEKLEEQASKGRDLLWDVVTRDVPKLRTQLAAIPDEE